MKHGKRLLGAMLAVGAAFTAGTSCQYVAGLQGDFRAAPPDGGSAGDAGDAGDAGTGGCTPATYPDPPSIPDDGTDIGPVVVAVHSIDLGDMGTVPGYDLDHVCTCFDDAGPSCAGRSMDPTIYCDEPGGIDNNFARIVQLIELAVGASGFSSQSFSSQADTGHWTLLVQVSGYNGGKDDPSVQVGLLPAAGLGTTPKWDGTDSWPILQTAVDSMGNPIYAAMGAYVANHTLVATVPTVPITFAGVKQTITLTLSGAVLTGQLVQSNGQWRLIQGVLAARLGLSDFFKTLSSYRDSAGMPICTNGFFYSTAKTNVCGDADILLDGTEPSSTTCDALSFGMGFTADPAIVGPKVPVPTPSPGCPAGMDPAGDSCPP